MLAKAMLSTPTNHLPTVLLVLEQTIPQQLEVISQAALRILQLHPTTTTSHHLTHPLHLDMEPLPLQSTKSSHLQGMETVAITLAHPQGQPTT